MGYKVQQLTTTWKVCCRNFFFCILNVLIIVSHEPGWSSVKCVCVCVWSQTHSLTHSPGLFGRVGLLLFVVNTLPCLKNVQNLCLRDIKTQGMGRHTLFLLSKNFPILYGSSLSLVVSQELKPVTQNASKPHLWSSTHSPPPGSLFHVCLIPHVPSFAVLLSIRELLF